MKYKLGFFKQRSLHEIILDREEETLEEALRNNTDCNMIEYITVIPAMEGVCDEEKIFVTPLHLAVRDNQDSMVSMLLANQANIHALSGDGRKPIEHFDPEFLNRENLKEPAINILNTLFEYGASVTEFINYFGEDIFKKYQELCVAQSAKLAM